MDYNKEIELMARILCTDYGHACSVCPFGVYPLCQAKNHARKLLEAGYRKINNAELEKRNDEQR